MTIAELIGLCRSAVEFANKAAGEGIEIDGIAPEDFLMRYSDSTGFEDWDNIGQHTADALEAAKRENERLTGMLRQCFGMAEEGYSAPTAAYRWCERIDEVIYNGAAMEEYAQWARDLLARAALSGERQEGEG